MTTWRRNGLNVCHRWRNVRRGRPGMTDYRSLCGLPRSDQPWDGCWHRRLRSRIGFGRYEAQGSYGPSWYDGVLNHAFRRPKGTYQGVSSMPRLPWSDLPELLDVNPSLRYLNRPQITATMPSQPSQRLRDDRRDYCRSGSKEDNRWVEACNTLLDLLNGMRGRRELEHQDLATAMREYTQEFEHSSARIDRILHSEHAAHQDVPDKELIYDWIDLAYRVSTSCDPINLDRRQNSNQGCEHSY